MLPRINVVPVTVPPAIGKVQMQQGIRTREEAQNWAGKNGYTTVYWLKSRQRVYADKTSKFEKIVLFAPKEQGHGLLEFLIGTALVLIILLVLGQCGKPW